MDLLTHIDSRDAFLKKTEEIIKKVSVISEEVSTRLKPPYGTYMFFHHNTCLLMRVKELRLIIERLYNNRIELLKMDSIANLLHQTTPNKVPSAGYQEILTKLGKIDEQIILDFQTMLLFTAITLDELAHLAGYILNAPNPKKTDFRKILIDKDGTFILFRKYKKEMLWLDVFSRLYRNKMIVHREEPWQMSHSRSVYQLDWQFTTPISNGWLSDEEIESNKKQMENLATKKGLPIHTNMYSTLSELMNNLYLFEQDEQKDIYIIAEKLGFNLPTFQAHAHTLVNYLDRCLSDLIEYSRTNINMINLGAPAHLRD